MGNFENIIKHDGLGIAATGMIIVFAALTFISLFIYLLPKVLSIVSYVVPPSPEPQLATQIQSNDDEEIAAAIGFALHQDDAQRTRIT